MGGNVCNEREKKCILTRCGHTFCRECIDTRIANRDRKCPSCGDKFGPNDVSNIWLTG